MLLHLLLHSVKTYGRSESGHRLKQVNCEKCKTEYWYLLSRVGTGSGSYVIGSGNAAAARAQENAKKTLARRLDREAELVPCPKCDWINEDLLARVRKRQYRQAPIAAIVLLIVGFLAYMLISLNAEGYRWSPALAWEVSSVFAIIAILIFPIRALLRGRLNPNHSFPNQPELPVGTPSAMVKSTEPASQGLKLVDVRYPSRSRFAGWAVLRAGQLVFPKVCSLCLNETVEVYRPRLSVNKEDTALPVPVCAECRRSFRRIWLLTALLTLVGVAVIGGATAMSIHGIDEFGRWMIFILIALFGSLFGIFVIPNQVCRPYRFGIIDKDRGVMKFAAKNEHFTNLLVEQARQSDEAIASHASS